MATLTGPEIAQVAYKPVIEISDSKKYDDGVTLKLAGTNGSTEFTPDEVVTIYQFLGEFLTMKGLGGEITNVLRHGSGLLGSSLREGESITITHN